MDAFRLLKQDHEKVKGLFAQFEAASTSQEQKRLFAQIKSELELHTRIEEKAVYPLLKEQAQTKEKTDEALQEHHVVKTLLQEATGVNPEGDAFPAKVKVMRENVEHHVQEEEGEMFPLAQKILSAQQQQQIAREIEAMKGASGKPMGE
jgi:hemerythrin superfamily protein